MSEKALATTGNALAPTTDITSEVHHSGETALIKTVHGELDTVVAPDGRLIVGVSQRPDGVARTLSLEGVISDATDIVGQGREDARESYGQVYVVISRTNDNGERELQETLIDYPNKKIITNPGAPNQHEYPAEGLPQAFTTGQPYQFLSPTDPSKPKTSNGTVVAAYMYAPQEGAAVESFDPAAIARGDIAALTHGFVDPAAPITPQVLKEAPVAVIDPIAAAAEAAQRVMMSGSGSNTPPALH